MIISPPCCQSAKFPFICRLYQEINIVSELSLSLRLRIIFSPMSTSLSDFPLASAQGRHELHSGTVILCHSAGLMHLISSFVHYTISNSLIVKCCQDFNDISNNTKHIKKLDILFCFNSLFLYISTTT